jgi:uncharacterized membrane protein YedE/YeeE
MPGRPARWIYGIAAAYGFLVLTPLLFVEGQIAKVDGRPLGHPEYYYGFLGAALVFQFVFVLIARHPVRLRPVMVATIFEKLTWGAVVAALVLQGRTHGAVVVFAAIDVLWAPLFGWAYARTPKG